MTRPHWADVVIQRTPAVMRELPELLLLAYLCMATGGPLLVLGSQFTPGAIDDLLPPLLVRTWAACLFIGGLLVLVGLLGRFVGAARLLVAGLMLLAPASLTYAVCIIVAAWPRGLFAALTYLLFTAALLIRAAVVSAALEARRRRLQ